MIDSGSTIDVILTTTTVFSEYPAESEHDPSPVKLKKDKVVDSPVVDSVVL